MAAHGGKRPGAGRTAGSGWKPKVAAMRHVAVTKMHAIVAAEDDPLSVVVSFALDPELDIQTRMSAASIALPYLYPRLSATTVDAKHTVVNVDASELMGRLSARLERIASVEPPPLIDSKVEMPDKTRSDE